MYFEQLSYENSKLFNNSIFFLPISGPNVLLYNRKLAKFSIEQNTDLLCLFTDMCILKFYFKDHDRNNKPNLKK